MQLEEIKEIEKAWENHGEKLQDISHDRLINNAPDPRYYSMTMKDVFDVRRLIDYAIRSAEKERSYQRHIDELTKTIEKMETDVRKLDVRFSGEIVYK